MRRRIVPVAALLLLLPSIARAEEDDDDEPMIVVEPPEAEVVPAPPRTDAVKLPRRYVDVSYSSQTLLMDGVAVAAFGFGIATDTPPLPGIGILTYGLGAPIVHFTHGNVGKGIADIAIRVVAPIVFAVPGLMIAIAATPRADYEARQTAMDIGGFTGIALGAAFAMAIDALVLAKDRVPEERAYFRDDARREVRGTTASASSARRVDARP